MLHFRHPADYVLVARVLDVGFAATVPFGRNERCVSDIRGCFSDVDAGFAATVPRQRNERCVSDIWHGFICHGCRICSNGFFQSKRMLHFRHPGLFFNRRCRICSNGSSPAERTLQIRHPAASRSGFPRRAPAFKSLCFEFRFFRCRVAPAERLRCCYVVSHSKPMMRPDSSA